MAVKELDHKVHKYIGDTADTKPTAATHNTTAGSTYYDRETGIMYITYDGTNWVEKDTVVRLETSPSIDIGQVGHDITGLADGVKVVTTAGTDVALVAASTPAKLVIIQAQTDNTGLIAVGNVGVDATEATGTGIILYAGDTTTLPVDDLADVYIDATVNLEGVRFAYFT